MGKPCYNLRSDFQEEAAEEFRAAGERFLAQLVEGNEAAAILPAQVQTFLEPFEFLDVRKARALLQTILKAIHVGHGTEIEVEFSLRSE